MGQAVQETTGGAAGVPGRCLLTAEEVAERIRVPVATIRYLRSMRRFAPGIRVGRRVVWDVVDVDEWLSAQRERPS
jgi:predicted DNA-binding transcriptional regulator AlpA